ncbi:MAG: filamentous hemagglutinin N-terminal domain-containing protein, partial [Verrucomicrobia bacterium]|nr:filamentous hemagglutinin N-terminal domain-containing protein [Leptolyngbya sp. ES-bin-22]
MALGLIGFGAPAVGQVVPDATLGAERSRVSPDAMVRGASSTLIEGGAVRGSNLFQSFQEFNVGDGQRVYFANPIGVQNIFSRVTGANASNIFGTLGVAGGANLFLLNPNGILFGPNAQLDIRGSFLATTGDRVVFSDGNTFGASNPQAAPLLTMSAPVGVQYGAGAATIRSQANLAVGQDLTLAAGNLALQGRLQSGGNLTLQAQDTVQIRDSASQPFTATAGSRLLIQGDRSVDIFALNHPLSGFFAGGDLILRSANTVGGDAHFQSGGNFRIEQMDGTAGNLFSPHDPVILANGDVTLGDYSGASLHILAGGSVTLGNISITGTGTTNDTINPGNPDPFLASLATVQLSNGETILLNGSTSSTLDVRAGVNWSQLPGFPGNTGIGIAAPPTTLATSANIVLGDVDFTSPSGGMVFISNQYVPNGLLPLSSEISVGAIDTGGNSAGGAIVIDARDRLTTQGLLITSAFSANGSSGNVLLRAGGDLRVMDDIDAASVAINDPNTLLGTSGNVDVWAGGSLTLSQGANIFVNGIASGDVTLKSEGDIQIANSVIDSTSASNDVPGNASSFSTVQIESLSGSVFLSNVEVSATNAGSANAGDLFIKASNRIEIANSKISSDGYLGRIFIGS